MLPIDRKAHEFAIKLLGLGDIENAKNGDRLQCLKGHAALTRNRVGSTDRILAAAGVAIDLRLAPVELALGGASGLNVGNEIATASIVHE
jgi:hypothetical protein